MIYKKGATCVDTEGSFICKCPNGHRSIDDVCIDINECTENMHYCDSNAECKNTMGTYKCVCNSGYDGGGLRDDCFDIDECTSSSGRSFP